MQNFTYKGIKTREISFPLGGIGSGCIGLGGDGRLVDWEILNRPNKGSMNGFSHFAIKAEAGGKVIDTRILQGDLQPPYAGTGGAGHSGFGFGPDRTTLAGMPHFSDVVFEGRYPFANISYRDRNFPGKVKLTAFNPLIPLNEDDSSIPAAFFEFSITNTTQQALTYTIAGTLGNPFDHAASHRIRKPKGMTAMQITSVKEKDSVSYGDVTLATDSRSTSHQHHWYRGSWFDSLEVYWKDLTAAGKFHDRKYRTHGGSNNQALLASHIRVKPGTTRTVRYIITWNIPNCENYSNNKAKELAKKARIPEIWKNYYATLWKDSTASAAHSFKNWKRLYSETKLFHKALFSSSLPPAALDAVSANISILKSPTVLRLTDGTLYGFEGCRSNSGCCPGSCTHVWNYAQAHAFLFPRLARSMREADYRYNQQKDGAMPFRMPLPLGIKHPGQSDDTGYFPLSCADGLFGCVMLVYREWKVSGDTEWMKALWPNVKKAVSYSWATTNQHRWDPDKTGVLWGRQHHTLDMELYGPSSWLCGFYLGALKAAAEMAETLGDLDTQADFLDLFASGKNWMEKSLFNGEYYHQLIDIKDRRTLKSFGAEDSYWDSEHREIKYQIDLGCAIDQTLAQYHASLYGLGEVFDPGRNHKALESLFKYNFHETSRDVYNPCRIYSLNDEGGIAICSWPEHVRKPAIPLTYAQETMHGFEYAAAVQMIQNGMVREGMKIVKSIRDRYDGERRNPWNEFECGSNYARSMASYGLLNAFSGFEFDMTCGHVGFHPVKRGRFSCFWSLGPAWGTIELSAKEAKLTVLRGKLKLESLALPFRKSADSTVKKGSQHMAAERDGDILRFSRPVTLAADSSLAVKSHFTL